MPLQGKCLCGKIKVAVDDASLPLKFMACYCLNCHTTAGSPFSMVAPVELEKLKVEGEPKSCECASNIFRFANTIHSMNRMPSRLDRQGLGDKERQGGDEVGGEGLTS
jgi:hypothetical protein